MTIGKDTQEGATKRARDQSQREGQQGDQGEEGEDAAEGQGGGAAI